MRKVLIGLILFGLVMAGRIWSEEGIKLPAPELKAGASINYAIQSRRSVRSYKESPLSLKDISQLLWSAQGITDPKTRFRSAPSAGAIYPLSVYVVVQKKGVDGLSPGIYLYVAEGHGLKQMRSGDFYPDLVNAALNQDWIKRSSVVFIFTGEPFAMSLKYKERAWQYIFMGAGMAAENLILQAVAMGLGSCPVGAFYDEKVAELIRLKGNEKPLLVVPVGKME